MTRDVGVEVTRDVGVRGRARSFGQSRGDELQHLGRPASRAAGPGRAKARSWSGLS
jgi:hypothetical protein